MKILLMASIALGVSSTSHPGCEKTYTLKMGERAMIALYSGDRPMTRGKLRMVRHFEHCQRRSQDEVTLRHFAHHQAKLHHERIQARIAANSLSYATASWYDDTGATASGYHAFYGVANKYLAFGTRVRLVYHGREVTAVVDDRGPYVGGRDWDLNQNVAATLGFGGVDTVGYHIG